jgi:PAS domain S-box-containing protein
LTLERRYWKSGRIALAYIVFSVLALALFATPLWYGWRVNVGTLRIFVPEDMQKLPDLFLRDGAAAVAAAVRARSDPTGMEVIAFAGPGKELLAGTLRRWPDEIPDRPGTYGHVIDPGDGSSIRVVVSHVFLPGGYHLLLGRQSSGLMSLQGSFWYGMAAAITIVMGLGGVLAWVFARRARDARHSEERYALAMKAAGDGHIDWNLRTGEHYISSRLLEICGHAPGATFQDRAEWIRRFPFHPADRSTWEQAVAAHFAGRESNFKMALRIIVDGEVRWTALHFFATRDAAGTPIRWTGSIDDITEQKRAEEALRRSEESYALAVAGSDDGVWDVDFVARRAFVSARARELAGLPPGSELIPLEEFFDALPIHPEDLPRRMAAVEAHLAGQTPAYEGEFRIRQLDGHYRWRRIHGLCVRDLGGNPHRMAGSISDVDARRRTEEALRLSEERYALAVAGSDDGVWDIDFVNRHVFISARSRELMGMLPGPEMMPWDEWSTSLPIHPDDRPRRTAALQAHLAGETPAYVGEFRILQRDGRYRWRRLRGLCVRNPEGQPSRMAGSITDIDVRHRTEEALRLSEERTRLALEASEEGHFDLDVVTDDLFVSDRMCDILGYPPGSRTWKGSDFMKEYPFYENDIDIYNAVVEPATARGGPDHYEFEFRIVRPPGEVRWLWTRAKITRDAEGNAVRRTGMARDITEAKFAAEALRTMEQELRRAQRLEAIGTLAGGIAHDFNNILGAILGYGEMATRGVKKGTRLRRDLDSIMLAGERGRALVDRVLAFSRSGVGERVPVHVEAVVHEALDQAAAILPENVTIARHLRAGRAAMLGDSTQVHQVVMNLASNAVQAMPWGGVLRVTLETLRVEAARPATLGALAPGDYIVLTLGDAGTGIREDVIERIFDPFFTTKEVGVGTGLGLSLVHGIVASVGGAIDVATRLGEGTTFTVYVPRSGDAMAKMADKGLPLPRGAGQRVLVVDDEEPLVCLAMETLESLGYKPIGFTSSVNALQEFRADPERFDAILTDERMPGVTGLAIVREVRRMNSSVPILLMTGFVGGAVTEARELGANDVLKKPLLARDLATSLARALRP